MPTYDYVCDQCGHSFEKFQSAAAAPVKVCPQCGGPTRRLIGAGAGVIVKGGAGSGGAPPRCGRAQTCCGRETPCAKPPCGD